MTTTLPNIENLCSGMFSDSMDKLGYRHQIISGFLRNHNIIRFMGCARTVKIETIETDDENINLGLSFLGNCNKSEILVVSGSHEFAYFGEMMTRLSLRQEIGGVVIDGLTRDTIFTHDNCKLPIVAKGYSPVDIKGRGRVAAVDIPITVSGISIKPGYLIFADNDAVCVVPPDIEQELVMMIHHDIAEEQKIVRLIDSGASISEILGQVKSF
jgi:regulator of RNase E activity RraA